jgi:cytochrome o ubiquinol oxidase subunit II
MKRFRGHVVAALALIPCASCARDGFIAPAGPISSQQLWHFGYIVGFVSIVVVPVFLFLPWVLWKYRLSSTDTEYRPDWTFSWIFEIAIWGVPVLIVAALSWQTWAMTHRLDPYRRIDARAAPPLRVQAIGYDWKWLFIYPDEGIATVNRLVVPQGRNVAFSLTADGPMMSFMVPRLGGQIYAMAGMTTQLHLVADREGHFTGLNTQYNGKGFARQRFQVTAMSPTAFDHWVTKAHAAPALDVEALGRLSRPSVMKKPLVFGQIPQDLFRNVVAKYHHGHRVNASDAEASR